jgi:hypothetical protein
MALSLALYSAAAADNITAHDNFDDELLPLKGEQGASLGQIKVANVDAWTSKSSTSSLAKGINGTDSDHHSAADTAKSGLWSVAADEVQEKRAREQKLRQEVSGV